MKHTSIHKTIPTVLIILLILVSILLLLGLRQQNNTSKTLESTKTSLIVSIMELQAFPPASLQSPLATNKIFISQDEYTGAESLYISDNQLSPQSFKKIYTPVGPEYNLKNIRLIDNYILVDVLGGDQSSFVLFNPSGTNIPITGEQLTHWNYSYNHYNELTKRIVVDLSQINGSRGTAEIDITSGKLVPGSVTVSSR